MTDKPSYEELEARIRELEKEQAEHRRQGRVFKTGIIDDGVVGFYRSTPGGRFTWMNRAFSRILGYGSPEEALAEISGVRSLVDFSGRKRRMKTLTDKGAIENFKHEIRQKNGSLVWVSESARRIRGRKGDVIGYEGMVMDITHRKRSEQARKDTEDFLALLIDAIPVPVFYKDRAGRYVGFNKAFESFFGRGREELIGRTVHDISPGELADVYHAKDEELFESGGTQRYESQVKDTRGRLRDVIFDKSVYTDAEGRTAGLIGTVLDITDRKEIEERFRAVFEDANDGILVADSATKKFVMANNIICRMLGYTRREILGLSVNDIHPEEDLEAVLNAFERQALNEIRMAENLPVKRKDGTLFYADINSSPIRLGDDTLLVGIFRDTTERREMEAALKKSEERFREMAELLPGAVVETDIDVNVTYVNRHGLNMFGLKEEDVAAGLNGLLMIHPEERARAGRRILERISKQSVLPTEYRMLTKDGRMIWVYLNAAPIFRDDEVIGFRIVLTDLSERKQVEKEREELIGELKEALAEIRTLKGIVPICAKCKKIRDDTGYWNKLESFIQKHSHASFSHSLCPDCSDALYGKEDWYKKMKKKDTSIEPD